MLFATVPAAPPTRKNQRTTSCPAPISAKVPYQRGSRLILSALEWVSIVASFTARDLLNSSADETREFPGDIYVTESETRPGLDEEFLVEVFCRKLLE